MKELEEILDAFNQKLLDYPKLTNEIDRGFRLQALQQAYSLGQQSKWIAVEKELPDRTMEVLVTNGKVTLAGSFYIGGFIMNLPDDERQIYTTNFQNFTHWQPLPDNPKK